MNNASKDLVSSVLKFSQEFYDRFFSDVIDIQRNELDESAIHPSEFQKMKSFESFQLVTDAIKELIELKRNFKLFQTFKNTSNDKIYQKALQKLESITRDHIKVQHQLRIYLEELQCDFDASIFNTDKAELQFLKEVDDLQAEKTSLEVLIDQKDKKIKSLKSQGSRKIEVSETERKTHSFDVAGGAT